MKNYYCYLIYDENLHTYIGITTNLSKRLKQHNGKIKGGAKSTRRSKKWKYAIILGTFHKSSCLSFEWYWKHNQNKKREWIKTKSGFGQKLKRLIQLLLEKRWSNLKLVSVIDLK